MFAWILKMLPIQYSYTVAIKKISYTVGKLAVTVLTMTKAKAFFGDNLTPAQITEIQTVIGGFTAATLEGLHDWLHVKFPNVKWL